MSIYSNSIRKRTQNKKNVKGGNAENQRHKKQVRYRSQTERKIQPEQKTRVAGKTGGQRT